MSGHLKNSALLLAAALLAGPALASDEVMFPFKANPGNRDSLQRGARNYMAYCSGCHSLKYLRYNRLGADLGIPEDMLKKYLMFTSEKPGDTILSSMPGPSADPTQPSESENWFGKAPPDLTLETRYRGPDWVYSYLLSFYLDPKRPTGVNNTMLPNAAMPHVLGDLQGWQKMKGAEHEGAGEAREEEGEHKAKGFDLVQPGRMKPDEYKAFVGDLVNFMVYAAEPGRNGRVALGWKVLIYIVIFGICCFLLKKEFWKDVH
jgi:ubiquinol-cytochrome c reductase cytochrome c1 subunit